MREIEFRAFSRVRNPKRKRKPCEMIYFGLKEYAQDQDGEWGDFELSEERLEGREIMQYTGLKDKNGKEIYEGDIVKHQQQVFDEFGEHVSKVFYKAPSFMMENISGKLSGLWALTEQYAIDNHQAFEIIGNIYENPDLLNP